MARIRFGARVRAARAALVASALLARCAGPREADPGSKLSLARARGIAGRVAPGRDLTPAAWPGGRKVAVALTFDLDADLVVLSTCETARGEAQAGEGVESFARAFLYAGARAVVASLWQVADWAAAGTMQAFYRGRESSLSGALREAKLAVRRSTELRGVTVLVGGSESPRALESAHPFFSAPFLYIGTPR